MANIEQILRQLGQRSLFLTGFMGTGKTTVGIVLSKLLDIPFYDLDQIIESQENSLVLEIFSSRGEGSFRQIESVALDKIISMPAPNVIAFGGGALENEVSRAKIRNRGILIALKSNPVHLLPRLNESQIGTLLIMTGRSISDAMFMDKIAASIEELYERRKKLYDDVDFSVNSGGRRPDEIAEEILNRLGKQSF